MAEGPTTPPNSFGKLAKALGIAVSTVHGLVEAGKLPARRPDGTWDLDACMRALAEHRRGVLAQASPTSPAGAVPPAQQAPTLAPVVKPDRPAPPVTPNELTSARATPSTTLDAAQLRDREILERADDPLETARAGARVASRLLAQFMGTPLAVEALESLKRSLDGLRLFEADALELGVRRGELVPRAILRVLGGTLGQRASALFERGGVRLPTQIEEWLGDKAFLAATTGERAVIVREWWSALARGARTSEAAEVEKIIEAELADRASAEKS